MVVILGQLFVRNVISCVASYFQDVVGDGNAIVTAEWLPGEQNKRLSDGGVQAWAGGVELAL
jgi:hypothetical protein